MKYCDTSRRANGEGIQSIWTDTEGRNRRDPKGFDTLAVYDVNDEHWRSLQSFLLKFNLKLEISLS